MDSSQHSYLQLSQEVRYELPVVNHEIINSLPEPRTPLRKRLLGDRRLVDVEVHISAERLINEHESEVQPQHQQEREGAADDHNDDESPEKKRDRKDVENIAPCKLEGE